MKHHYLGMNLPYKDSLLSLLPSSSILYHERCEVDSGNTVTVNTVLEGNVTTCGEKAYIFDSWIGRNVSLSLVGPSVLNGLWLMDCAASLEMPGGCVWQQYTLAHHNVVTCHGWTDHLAQHHEESTATVFNTSWSVFLSKTGIQKEDLWENSCEAQDLLSAKIFLPGLPIAEQISIISTVIRAACGDSHQEDCKSQLAKWIAFPRVSLAEAMFNCDVKKVIQTQEVIFLESFKQYLIRTADDLGGMSLIPLFQYFVKSKNIYLFLFTSVMNRIEVENFHKKLMYIYLISNIFYL